MADEGKQSPKKAADMSGKLTSEIKDMFSKSASSGDDEKAAIIELPHPLCVIFLTAGGRFLSAVS